MNHDFNPPLSTRLPVYGDSPEQHVNKLLREALEKLLKVSHPASPEAAWAAQHLKDEGFDPRPAQPCGMCRHSRYMHGRNVCYGEGCKCPARG